MMEDRFGLPEDEYCTLTKKVTIVLHMAATIDFTERLDIAVKVPAYPNPYLPAVCMGLQLHF